MADGTKVGDVYVEGRVEYDGSSTPAFFSAMQRDLKRRMPQISKDVQSAFSKGMPDPEVEVDKNGNKWHNAGRSAGRLLAIGASAGIHDNARFLRDAMIIGMAGAGTVIGTALSAAVQAAFAIGPAALGVMPSLLLATAGAAGVLKVAFIGVKDAIKSAFKDSLTGKDLKDFEKSLAKMAPATREFIVTLAKAKPALEDFKRSIQQAFFEGSAKLVPEMTRGLKVLKPAAAGVADGFRDIALSMAHLLLSKDKLNGMSIILKGVRSFTEEIRPGLLAVVGSFFDLGVQGSQFAKVLGEKVNAELNRLAAWIAKADLKKMFKDAQPALEDIWRIIVNVGRALKALFGNEDDKKGGGPLELLADMSDKLVTVAQKVRALIDWFNQLPKPIKDVAAAIGLLVIASYPLTSLVGIVSGLAGSFKTLALAITPLVGSFGTAGLIIAGVVLAILAFAAVLVLAWTRSEEFRDRMKKVWKDVKKVWEDDIKPLIKEIGKQFEDTLKSIEDLMAEFGLGWGDLAIIIGAAIFTIIALVLVFLVTFLFAMETIKIQIDFMKLKIQLLKEAWNAVWGAMKEAAADFGRKFAEVVTGAREAWDKLVKTARDSSGMIRDSVTSAFNTLKNSIQTIWNEIANAVKTPIKAVVQFINSPLIAGFNTVAKAVGINGITPIAMARGGMVPGMDRGYDTVPAMLRPGEGVLTVSEVNRLGGPAGFAAMRDGIQNFASGGIVQQLGSYFGSGLGSLKSIAGNVGGFSGDQLANAAEIVRVGKMRGLPSSAWIIAVATAMQESGLRNLGNLGASNDHDSVGLFQQRPSSGWGSVAELTNPTQSASKFYDALTRVGSWMTMPLTRAAQAVQRSAFPSAYAQWEGPARQIVNALTGGQIGGGIFDFLSDPIGKFISGMGAEMPKFGDNFVGKTMGAAGTTLVTGAAHKLFDHIKGFGGDVVAGVGGGGGAWPSGPGAQRGDSGVWRGIVNLAKSSGIPFSVSNAYRPGDPLWHGSGRAVDFGGFNQDRLAHFFLSMRPRILELIHSTALGNYGVSRGRLNDMGPKLWGEHKNHLHVAMDQGGWLQPGMVAHNFTSKPEPVFTAGQWDTLTELGTGSGVVVENNIYATIDGYPIEMRIQSSNQKIAQGLRRGRGR